ncbi:MAG TPA: DUF6370 family protein [Bacteroidia bacterium]|nr:MAG: hypothetical protein UZ10_BCD003001670 [Bacteroidetes bacterium OLB10]MBE7509706.1 hypothetical protein [Bacteroidia bacterium]MBX3105955.1 hypothetical protein [Bacteroidota bacterium]OQB64664.1 MAG: hypothetical protein BWX95_00487 [Bacteroidetes bacterium ADurb.Bin141]MCB8930630.1 hypothetical protein [Bacteroidia bacterium]
MKSLLSAVVFLLFVSSGYSQVAKSLSKKPDPSKELMLVEASCGECNYGMPGNDCDLAVKIKDSTYYVDGVGIFEFGHPHDKNGFCVAVRHAEVQGEVVNGRFKASYFKLLKEDDNNNKAKEN